VLFSLCRSKWVISCLSFFLFPSRSSNTPLYPWSVTIQGACLDSLFFRCFHCRLSFESVKELGNASPIVYKQKFNAIYKLYKDDKITNEILDNDHHECLFNDALDSWWHQNKNVMKHVNVFINEIDEIVNNSKFQTKFDKSSKDDDNKGP
jgi:hypothetical protein